MCKKLQAFATLLAGLAAVSACSGGGDGSGIRGINPPPTSQLVAITEDNAVTVAGVAAEQVVADDFVGVLTTTGLPIVGAGSSAAQQMLSLSGADPGAGLAAAQMTLQDCAVSGTVDVTFSVADPQVISPNDRFAFDFDACDEGTGAVVSGGLEMTVTGFSGDPAAETFFLSVDLALTGFTVTQAGVTSAASGTIALAIDNSQPTVTTITVSADALTVTQGAMTETVSDLSVTIVEDQSMFPSAVTVETSLRFSSPRLGGDVIVSTSVALQSSGEDFPYAGEITIRGAGNASIRLLALDANTVRLDVDLDGDSAADVTIDATWSELMALAESA